MPGKEPKKLLLRRSDVMEWAGLSSDQFQRLLTAGTIQGVVLPGCKRRFYKKEHIREVLITAFVGGSEL